MDALFWGIVAVLFWIVAHVFWFIVIVGGINSIVWLLKR